MALLHTPAAQSNFIAPDFELKGTDGQMHTIRNLMAEQQAKNGLAVAFICNHCPYVLAIIDRLARDFKAMQAEGVACVAIMPNDTINYPDDSFENMIGFAKAHNFTFPYVIDETQDVARAYDAVCTPDLFGFDAELALRYRGRLDSAANNHEDSRTIPEMFNAMQGIAEGRAAPPHQKPSMGCSIKWR